MSAQVLTAHYEAHGWTVKVEPSDGAWPWTVTFDGLGERGATGCHAQGEAVERFAKWVAEIEQRNAT